jgi:GT2 family glycosyltransferase
MIGSVAIAISAFRSNAAVIELLEAIFDQPHPEVGVVIVVDSLGDGEISKTAAARGWPVGIENFDRNIGSAGNLARRMELANEIGAEWCLCLNHDANWSPDRLDAMLRTARSRPRVGAVYPVLDHSPREPRWQEGHQDFTPSSHRRHSDIPADEHSVDVLWGISNFALYATAPRDEGVVVMADLWMGYEDLAYGIALNQAGWKQLCCRAAILSGAFDYVSRQFLGRALHIPQKPAWYSYYNIRNLLLIRRRYGIDGIPWRSIVWKFVQSALRIIILEENKFLRIRFLFAGAFAGLAGKDGKGPVP